MVYVHRHWHRLTPKSQDHSETSGGLSRTTNSHLRAYEERLDRKREVITALIERFRFASPESIEPHNLSQTIPPLAECAMLQYDLITKGRPVCSNITARLGNTVAFPSRWSKNCDVKSSISRVENIEILLQYEALIILFSICESPYQNDCSRAAIMKAAGNSRCPESPDGLASLGSCTRSPFRRMRAAEATGIGRLALYTTSTIEF